MPKSALCASAGLLLCAASFAAEPTTQPLPRLETGMHTAAIRRIATDAAGRWAVTASDDKTARVWELASRRQVTVLRPPQNVGNEGKLHAVAMSPDGNVVAVSGWTGSDSKNETAIYLFESASGRLLHRRDGLPSAINQLAFSPDGRWLAGSFGGGFGVRIFDSLLGREIWRHAGYGGNSFSVDFSRDGRNLATTSDDGQVRLYQVSDGKVGQLKQFRPDGGTKPSAARFSPDARLLAVSFFDSPVVQVFDADSLQLVGRPDISGVDNGNLSSVAWTSDGRALVGAGTWQYVGREVPMRRWSLPTDTKGHIDLTLGINWSSVMTLTISLDSVTDVVPLPHNRLLFASVSPSWGVIDAAGRLEYSQRSSAIADLRDPGRLWLSKDGRRVGFGYYRLEARAASFDLAARRWSEDLSDLSPARTKPAAGLNVQEWSDSVAPTLNGNPIRLEPNEISRSLAIGPDAAHFVLGTESRLRLFDREGRELWTRPTPAVARAVNVTLDGRFVVAAYADGTIRWHRLGDGEELLAFFPHADGQRWIAWTPEGFFAASGPDAEELIGYHLNRGHDRDGDFISASQLREEFYQPGLISRRLEPDGDALVAEAVKRLGDARELLAGLKNSPPVVDLLSAAEVTTEGDVPVKVRVNDRGGGIGRFIYRIDGTELEGRPAGIIVDGTESRTFSLPPGRHEITVTATNTHGIESSPVRIDAEVRPRVTVPPFLHVLAVGVSRYREKALQEGVRFAADDAEAIAKLFGEPSSRLYRSGDFRVLTDELATGAAIRSALNNFSGIGVQDLFVLYLAGHGSNFEGAYHFIPWDAVYTSSAALRALSLTEDDIRDLLVKIPATKTLVLLDTCSAGGFGRQPGRGNIAEKDAIDRLSRLTGRAVIAATPDEKMAIEGEGGHGVFTFALLEGLRGKADRNNSGTVEVRELADYVEELLPTITRRKWGYEQFPVSSTQGNSFSLVRRQ